MLEYSDKNVENSKKSLNIEKVSENDRFCDM